MYLLICHGLSLRLFSFNFCWPILMLTMMSLRYQLFICLIRSIVLLRVRYSVHVWVLFIFTESEILVWSFINGIHLRIPSPPDISLQNTAGRLRNPMTHGHSYSRHEPVYNHYSEPQALGWRCETTSILKLFPHIDLPNYPPLFPRSSKPQAVTTTLN